MRRLRVLCRDEQLLRETVRGMLIEAGFGDVRAAEGRPEPKPGFGDLKTSERDQEARSGWSLPGKWDAWDWVLNGSGTMFDIIGFVLNFDLPIPGGSIVADTANVLCDVASVSIDSGQCIASIDAYDAIKKRSEAPEVKQLMVRDPAFRSTVATVLHAYEKNKYINEAMLAITGVAAVASLTEICLKAPADLVGSAPAPVAPAGAIAGFVFRFLGRPASAVEGALKALKTVVTVGAAGYQISGEIDDLRTRSWKDLEANAAGYMNAVSNPVTAAAIATSVVVLRSVNALGFDPQTQLPSLLAVIDKIAVTSGKPNPEFAKRAADLKLDPISDIIENLA